MIVVCTVPDDAHVKALQRATSTEVTLWSPGDSRDFDLTGVQAIWVRHPQLYEAHRASQDWKARASLFEHRAIWQGRIAELSNEVVVINPPWEVQRADLKIPQLKLAQRLFKVPEGQIVYSDDQLSEFLETHQGDWITKSITHDNKLVYQGDQAYMVVPQSVGEEVPFFPTYVQRRVPRVADLRATLIGSDIFIHRLESTLLAQDGIDSRESWGREDTRIYREEDTEFAKTVMTFFDSYGLPFGAADFIETPNGERFFLECNFVPDIQFLNDPELFVALARLLEGVKV